MTPPPKTGIDSLTISGSLPLDPKKAKTIVFLALDVDGVLTDGTLYYGPTGEVMKGFNVKDGMGIKNLMADGVEVALLSNGRQIDVVGARATDLGIKAVYVGRERKRDVFENWLSERSLNPDQAAYIGDDLNDLEVLRMVGLSACPADAVEDVKLAVDTVLTSKGGKGAVREFADTLLAARLEAS